jgi:CheY-like chemotaxis protein
MSKRILVVEDQPDNRQIIRDVLAPTMRSRKPKRRRGAYGNCETATGSHFDGHYRPPINTNRYSPRYLLAKIRQCMPL